MWSVFAMIQAEEFGIDAANIDKVIAETTNPEIKRMFGVEGDLNKGLGLDPKWAYNIIKMVGNYGENYSEFMGEKRSEEHTSELQSLMRLSYAVFCLKKKH